MTTQSVNTFTVLFFLRKSRIMENGEVPIALRITVNGQRAEVNIKRSIDPVKWDQNKE
ncbi:MAG: hypothetical protein LIO85_02690 [Rikenellaceae bacterium]|nr:hypothetical protein [Rikenellaceae bacterium]